MRCVIPGRSVKSFAKAVHCLSKIGEELYLEALPDGLAIRTVNLSRSAYSCFKFHSSFFLSYDDGSKDLAGDSQAEDMMKCKIAMKSCLTAFKSMNTIEKSVDRCKIDLDIKESRLVFLFYCKHGITKTHNLTFQECESLQAVFTKDLCPNFISAQARLLSEAVYNFPNNQDEVSLLVNPEMLKMKNYIEDEPDPNKVIHTEMTLVQDEFDSYQIGVDTEITFCLKELRAILSFAEYASQPLNVHFETGGKPIVFSIDGDATYEADFVLATLVDQPQATQSSQSSTVNTAAKSAGNKGKASASRKNIPSQRKAIPNGRASTEALRESSNKTTQNSQTSLPRKGPKSQHKDNVGHHGEEDNNDIIVLDDDGDLVDLDEAAETDMWMADEKKVETQKTSNKDANKSAADMEDFFSDSFPYQDKFSRPAKKLSVIPEASQENSCSLRGSAQPIMTPPSVATDASFLMNVDMPSLGDISVNTRSPDNRQTSRRSSRDTNDESLEDEDLDVVPGTPPSKKFKSMFFGNMSASKPAQLQPKPTGRVLAADTDDEDSD